MRKQLLQSILIDLFDNGIKTSFIAKQIDKDNYKAIATILYSLRNNIDYAVSNETVEKILKVLLNYKK